MSTDVSPKLGKDSDRERPAALRLEESLRDLVHEEMGVVRDSTRQQLPSRVDAFWLFLSVADAALLLWIIPDAMLANKRLELLGKIMTWLGGSLFVLGYVWFREFFLAYVRHRAFKVTLAIIPLMLVPFYFTQFDIFPISPVVEPSTAVVELNGEKRSIENLKVSLSRPIITVKLPGQDNERQFEVRRGDVLRSWFYNEQPYWPLLFEVPLGFNREGPETLEVMKEKTDEVFDRDFREGKPRLTFKTGSQEETASGTWLKSGSIRWSWPYELGVIGSIRLTLPYGRYRLTATYADREGCPKTSEDTLDVRPGIELSEASIKRKCEVRG